MMFIINVPHWRPALYLNTRHKKKTESHSCWISWEKKHDSVSFSTINTIRFKFIGNPLCVFCFFFLYQGAVWGVHDPLCELCLQPGQPRPFRELLPVTWRAVGGAAEGAGSGAVVRRLQGGPGSHEVAEALLQVSWESWGGHVVVSPSNASCCVLGFRTCFRLFYDNWKISCRYDQ